MPNLSSLFTKFLFRETLTTEEKTAIRGDIGVPAPPTTESVLALLEDEELSVGSIVLGNGSALTLGVGELAGDGAGNAVIGDGETLGGIRLMQDVAVPSQHALSVITLNSPTLQSRFIEIGSVPLTADQSAEGTLIEFGIDLDVGLSSTVNLTELGLAFIATGETPGIYNVYLTPTAPASRNDGYSWRGPLGASIANLLGEVGAAQFFIGDKIQCLACPATSGNMLAHYKENTGPDGAGPQPITLGNATALKFGVWVKTSDASLVGSVAIKCRWTYRITTP